MIIIVCANDLMVGNLKDEVISNWGPYILDVPCKGGGGVPLILRCFGMRGGGWSLKFRRLKQKKLK